MAKWRVPTSDSSSVALKDKEHVAHGEQALRESELQLAASGPALWGRADSNAWHHRAWGLGRNRP